MTLGAASKVLKILELFANFLFGSKSRIVVTSQIALDKLATKSFLKLHLIVRERVNGGELIQV